MKVLCATNLFPLPTDFGSAVRVLDTIRALVEVHEVHVLAASRSGDTDRECVALERATGATVEVFAGSRRGEGLKVVRWARAIGTSTPTWISGSVVPSLAKKLGELAPRYDRLVLLDDYAAAYLDVLSSDLERFPPVVMDKHNVMGASMALTDGSGVAARARLRFELPAVRRFERRALARAATVVLTSDEEVDRANVLYDFDRCSVVRSGVAVPPAQWRDKGSSSVVSVANFHYAPNLKGMNAFLVHAWPGLERLGAELVLAGRAPEVLGGCHGEHGIRMLGFVEDLDSLLGTAAVGIAPLWAGAGVKLKTLTMLAAGLPVVATPVALEGIEAEDGVHCLIAHSPGDFTTQVGRLLADRALAARLGVNGRALVKSGYTWSQLGRAFVEVVDACGPTEPAWRPGPDVPVPGPSR